MKSIEQLASAAYKAFCEQAKASDFMSLPDYNQLTDKQKSCWVAAAQAVREEINSVR